METQFYLWINGEKQGPLTFSELAELWKSGKINRNTLYVTDSKTKWTPILDMVDRLISNYYKNEFQQPKKNSEWKRETIVMPTSFAGQMTVAGLALFSLMMLVALVGGIAGHGGGSGDDLKTDAYYTATEFAKKTYPGVENISDYRESVVNVSGDTYSVGLVVEGKNAFGGPVRKNIAVILVHEGDNWRMTGIDQQ